MKNFHVKFRIIYLPFLLLFFGFVGGYILLYYLLIIEWGIINVNEGIVDYLLPAALSFPLCIKLLHRRFKILKWKSANESMSLTYTMFMWVALAGTTILTVQYLKTASRSLIVLENISEISHNANARYVTIKNPEVHFLQKREASGYKIRRHVVSRRSDWWNFDVAFISPLYDSVSEDSHTLRWNIWMVVEFHEHLEGYEVGSGYSKNVLDSFYEQSWRQYDTTDYMDFTYLERLGNSTDYNEYLEWLSDNEKADTKDLVILRPVYEAFEKRGGPMLWLTLGAVALSLLIALLIITLAKIQEDKLPYYLSGQPIEGETEKGFLHALVPADGYRVTPFLLFMNCGVLAVMLSYGIGYAPTPHELWQWGASYAPDTLHGQWWRIFTSLFVHEGGAVWFIYTMLMLGFLSWITEGFIGSILFAALFLISAVTSGIADLYWYPDFICAGSSGSAFAMMGVLSVAAVRQLFRGGFNLYAVIPVLSLVFVGITYALDWDVAGNITGFITGVVFGLVIIPWLNHKNMDFEFSV